MKKSKKKIFFVTAFQSEFGAILVQQRVVAPAPMVLCKCGIPYMIKTSGPNSKTPGRKYAVCERGDYNPETKSGCGFGYFLDEQPFEKFDHVVTIGNFQFVRMCSPYDRSAQKMVCPDCGTPLVQGFRGTAFCCPAGAAAKRKRGDPCSSKRNVLFDPDTAVRVAQEELGRKLTSEELSLSTTDDAALQKLCAQHKVNDVVYFD
jgi:hypothetical protein